MATITFMRDISPAEMSIEIFQRSGRQSERAATRGLDSIERWGSRQMMPIDLTWPALVNSTHQARATGPAPESASGATDSDSLPALVTPSSRMEEVD